MRRGLLLGGLGLLGVLWLGPLPGWSQGSFSAHMLLHMGVVALAAPLLALGVAGSRIDPVRSVPRLFPPIPVSVLELVVVWTWHMPALHHAARNSTGLFVVEQGTFLLSGLWLWLSVFGGGPLLRAERRGAGVLALLLTTMHMTLLGALLALPPRPLFAHGDGHGGHDGAWLTPLEDQHLGGAIMLLLGGASYLAGGVWLMFELLRGRALEREGQVR